MDIAANELSSTAVLDFPSEVASDGRPLRILTFTSVFPNAAEPWRGAFVRDRMRAIARGADVEVMAPIPWSPRVPGSSAGPYQSHSLPRLDCYAGVTIHRPRIPGIPRLLKATEPGLLALSCAPALVALRRRFRFDLLDAGSACPDGVAAAVLAALTRVPFVVTVRGDDMKILQQGSSRRAQIQWALRRAALVITHSQELQGRVVALGVPQSRTAVIPDGVDVERFRPLDREMARACLGVPSSAHLLLAVGRLHRSHKWATLIEALARLAHEDPEVRLVILGDPDPQADATPDIRAAIARSGLQSRVTLVGNRSPADLVWWYNAADLYLATIGRGSAHPLVEAMACGLPYVTTHAAGNQELVTDERFGMRASADSGSLAQAIDVALRRWWDRDRIAEQVQSRAWDVVGREWCARLAAIGALQQLPS